MRLFGALFIMMAGGLLGCMPLVKLRERIKTLDTLIGELKRMRAELHSYGLSIPELMQKMGESVIFSSVRDSIEMDGAMAFAMGWKGCVAKCESCLTPQECQAVSALGDVLGRYAMEEQLSALDEVVEILQNGKEETKQRLQSVSRLYMGTSLCLSAMLVVLLL